MTPLMLNGVILSVIGGRLLLRVGYRPTCFTGFFLLTVGFVLLSSYEHVMARLWLYVDLALIGAGLGLSMLTLLIAVQQSVPSAQLGVATSLNQFSRSISGAVGVAVMGVVLSAGLTTRLGEIARGGGEALTEARAAELAADPSALVEPRARGDLPPAALDALRSAMAGAIHNVFHVAAALAAMALLATLFLPRAGATNTAALTEESCCAETGERMLVDRGTDEH